MRRRGNQIDGGMLGRIARQSSPCGRELRFGRCVRDRLWIGPIDSRDELAPDRKPKGPSSHGGRGCERGWNWRGMGRSPALAQGAGVGTVQKRWPLSIGDKDPLDFASRAIGLGPQAPRVDCGVLPRIRSGRSCAVTVLRVSPRSEIASNVLRSFDPRSELSVPFSISSTATMRPYRWRWTRSSKISEITNKYSGRPLVRNPVKDSPQGIQRCDK